MRSAIVVIVLMGASWYLFRNYEIAGLDNLDIRPRASQTVRSGDRSNFFVDTKSGWQAKHNWPGKASMVSLSEAADEPWRDSDDPISGPDSLLSADQRVRIGSWALGGFDREKASKPQVMARLAEVVRSLDVVALQQITGSERYLLPQMVEHINRTGRKYDFLLSPPAAAKSNPSGPPEQSAFLFDTERIVTDRSQFYSVDDPEKVFVHQPIVGWFRVLGPPERKAWTFTLVNLRIEIQQARREVAALTRLLQAVTNDGRGEDDTILLGLFQADDAYLVPTLGNAVTAAVRATPTDIFGRQQVANILIPHQTTTEYLGNGGVIPYLRQQNLTLSECEELTPHLPVFAEFSPREGLD